MSKKGINSEDAFEMYKSGKSYAQIAKQFKVTEGHVANFVLGELKKRLNRRESIGEAILERDLAILDDVIENVRDRAISGDDSAITSLMRILERRAKYLGLNAPDKVEASHSMSLADILVNQPLRRELTADEIELENPDSTPKNAGANSVELINSTELLSSDRADDSPQIEG